jgi:glyoxylase I family protein
MWQAISGTREGRENLNHFCIALTKETWQELLERLKANTVPIEEGPVVRWGTCGTGTSFYFRDPGGNLIEAKYCDDDEMTGSPVAEA